MLTIFSTLKPITKKTKLIQENALASWKALGEAVEIIIFGNDKGVSTLCKDYNIKQVKSIRNTKSKIPYVSDLFNQTKKIAKHNVLMYANADMIFTKDLLPAIKTVSNRYPKYLIVGRRTNLNVSKKINFNNPEEVFKLIGKSKSQGQLFDHTGIDYFIFNKSLFGDIPDLSIARNRWDNWMVAEGKDRSNMLIDATNSITAIHQNHDYSNVDQRKGRKTQKYAKETQKNIDLAAGRFASIIDANYQLSNNNLVHIPEWRIKLNKKIDFTYRVLDRKLKQKFGKGIAPTQEEVYS